MRLLSITAAPRYRGRLRLDEARRVQEPKPPFRTIELRDIHGKSSHQLGGRLVCRWRSFWIIAPGRVPVKVIHSDPRKARKF